eukprot:COSAG03_NODE_7747_length_877_cov_1.428021_2_plen_182_part_01
MARRRGRRLSQRRLVRRKPDALCCVLRLRQDARLPQRLCDRASLPPPLVETPETPTRDRDRETKTQTETQRPTWLVVLDHGAWLFVDPPRLLTPRRPPGRRSSSLCAAGSRGMRRQTPPRRPRSFRRAMKAARRWATVIAFVSDTPVLSLLPLATTRLTSPVLPRTCCWQTGTAQAGIICRG